MFKSLQNFLYKLTFNLWKKLFYLFISIILIGYRKLFLKMIKTLFVNQWTYDDQLQNLQFKCWTSTISLKFIHSMYNLIFALPIFYLTTHECLIKKEEKNMKCRCSCYIVPIHILQPHIKRISFTVTRSESTLVLFS